MSDDNTDSSTEVTTSVQELRDQGYITVREIAAVWGLQGKSAVNKRLRNGELPFVLHKPTRTRFILGDTPRPDMRRSQHTVMPFVSSDAEDRGREATIKLDPTWAVWKPPKRTPGRSLGWLGGVGW